MNTNRGNGMVAFGALCFLVMAAVAIGYFVFGSFYALWIGLTEVLLK